MGELLESDQWGLGAQEPMGGGEERAGTCPWVTPLCKSCGDGVFASTGILQGRLK